MEYPDSLKTILREEEFKFKEKGSQFLAFAHPCETEQTAAEFLEKLKKKYYDATHHCFCYEILPGIFKYSDDGEPNGTAGIRIQNAINHFELTNLIVVVVRYFGGTKLGVGPLGKSYYNAAYGVLETAKKIKKENYLKAELKYDFQFSKTAHHLLAKFDAYIQNNIYKESPSIIFLMKPEKIEQFSGEVKNSSNAQATVNIIEENIFVNARDF